MSTDISASPRQVPMGGTDCAQPMLYAKNKKLDVDVFIVYTDNETWAGEQYPGGGGGGGNIPPPLLILGGGGVPCIGTTQEEGHIIDETVVSLLPCYVE